MKARADGDLTDRLPGGDQQLGGMGQSPLQDILVQAVCTAFHLLDRLPFQGVKHPAGIGFGRSTLPNEPKIVRKADPGNTVNQFHCHPLLHNIP